MSGILRFSTLHRNWGILINTEDMQQRGGWSEAFQAYPLQEGIYAIFGKKAKLKRVNIKALEPRCVLLKPWEEDLGWHMGKPRCMFKFPTKVIKYAANKVSYL